MKYVAAYVQALYDEPFPTIMATCLSVMVICAAVLTIYGTIFLILTGFAK